MLTKTPFIDPSILSSEIAIEIGVRGTVQGVGFRPTIYQLATSYHLRGEVYNDSTGVIIRLAGDRAQIQQCLQQIAVKAPPLAKIDSIETMEIPVDSVIQTEFEITTSRSGQNQTQIAPDAATCSQCMQEILDPLSRFYRYPFTNCTHCGPRLSIVRQIPYDRKHTSMAEFSLCPMCQSEYENPLNRRFHAQPVACHRCGPKAWLERSDQRPIDVDMFSMLDDVDAVCTLLQQGEIVAVKGIGGIHLACDATNETAVSQLRQRKHRYHKPFALMVRDLSVIASECEISPAERDLLTSPAAPIVLLKRKSTSSQSKIAAAVAPNLAHFGVMLPYTPLHHLMLKRMDRPIVLTSGNLSDEPQCIDNQTARDKLGKIATYFLLHNRDIVNRVDDSVVRVVGEQRQTLRRARGYAPAPIPLPAGFEDIPPILAMGGELKSTFCLSRRGEAILSQHLGDLENATAFQAYQETLTLYQQLFEHQPVAIAADLHPNYLSTQLAHQLAQAQNLPLYPIQHHHAHIAACMVEQGLPLDTSPVLGIALDGLGYGLEGQLWGGEFLIADYRGFQRVAHLEPIAMLGGVQAIRQPWRNTYAHLIQGLGWDRLIQEFSNLELVQFLMVHRSPALDQMLATQFHSPLASSAGRLFDAVAAAVGCCREVASYEGQGAIELEALISPEALRAEPYPFVIYQQDERQVLSATSMWPVLLQDLQRGEEPSIIAARFHQGLAQGIIQLATELAITQQLQQIVLSGGVFQNQLLLSTVQTGLSQAGLTVLTPVEVPPNDGGLSLGQIAIAAAKRSHRIRSQESGACPEPVEGSGVRSLP